MSCKPGWNLGDKFCVQCKDNEFSKNDFCVSCGPSCLHCKQGPNKCLLCDSNSSLGPDGNCACNAGFYFDTRFQKCVACDSSCATCKDRTTCTSCAPGLTLGTSKCLQCASN